MRRWPFPAIGLGLVAITACEVREPIGPGEYDGWIFAAVVEKADSVFLSIGRSAVGLPNEGLTGAALWVVQDDAAVALGEAPSDLCQGPTNYTCLAGSAETLSFDSGELIRLRGTIPGIGFVEGATVVPAPPPVLPMGDSGADTVRVTALGRGQTVALALGPGEGVVLLEGGISLPMRVWTPEGARSCETGFGVPTGSDLRRGSLDSTSVNIWIPAPSNCADGPDPERWDSLHVDLTFLAYDENLSEWHRAGLLLAEPSQFGVQGVFGVFGSASARTIVVSATR